MEQILVKLKDLENPPKDFIFDKKGPEWVPVATGDFLRAGDCFKNANSDKWTKTTLIGQKNVSGNYYFRRKVSISTGS